MIQPDPHQRAFLNHIRKWMFVLAVLASVLCQVAVFEAMGAQYFVDFDQGADTNAGTDTKTSWKHCPGDPQAAAVAAGVQLAPGDVAMTLQRSSHITLAYNVFHSARAPAVADWDGLDHLAFYNNTVIGGTTGLTTGKNSTNITLKNNLIWPTSAAERSAGPFDISHNIYGKMPWPKKGETLHEGEIIVGEKEKLFRDFDRQDFRPPEQLPGKDKGIAIPRSVLDLARDMAGNPVPIEGVDIGAYQE